MGRGQQMSMNICMELQAQGKAHINMESEIRSIARQRRVVCVAMFSALITFTAYVVYINSGIPSEEDTSFFEEQLAPASLLGNPLTEDVSHFTNSGYILTDNNHTEPESGNGDSQPTSTVGDVEEAKANDLDVEDANLDESNPGSLNASADSSLSDLKVGTKSGQNVSTYSRLEGSSELPSPAVNSGNLLEESFQNDTKGAEVSFTPSQSLEEEKTGEQVLEDTTPTSASQNTLNLQTSKGGCNVEQGEWISDSRPPVYNSSTCRYIQGFQNCAKNGRSDVEYLYWK